MTDACSTTTASSRAVMSASIATVPTCQFSVPPPRGVSICGPTLVVLYPGNRTSSHTLPTSTSVKSKRPCSSLMMPATTELSLTPTRTTEAKGSGEACWASTTTPWTSAILGLAPRLEGLLVWPWSGLGQTSKTADNNQPRGFSNAWFMEGRQFKSRKVECGWNFVAVSKVEQASGLSLGHARSGPRSSSFDAHHHPFVQRPIPVEV